MRATRTAWVALIHVERVTVSRFTTSLTVSRWLARVWLIDLATARMRVRDFADTYVLTGTRALVSGSRFGGQAGGAAS